MALVTYVGKVLSDGHLSLPKHTRKALQLEIGQEVEVVVRTCDDAQPLTDEAYELLRKLIGLAKTGKPDASVHHDTLEKRHAALNRLLSLQLPVDDWEQMEEEIINGAIELNR